VSVHTDAPTRARTAHTDAGRVHNLHSYEFRVSRLSRGGGGGPSSQYLFAAKGRLLSNGCIVGERMDVAFPHDVSGRSRIRQFVSLTCRNARADASERARGVRRAGAGDRSRGADRFSRDARTASPIKLTRGWRGRVARAGEVDLAEGKGWKARPA
jgi:hypothetical protein